jgi:hypothetical protein
MVIGMIGAKYRDFNVTVGTTYGRFTVIRKLPESTPTNSRYQCRCECGVELAVYGHQLARAAPKGCIRCRRADARKSAP